VFGNFDHKAFVDVCETVVMFLGILLHCGNMQIPRKKSTFSRNHRMKPFLFVHSYHAWC